MGRLVILFIRGYQKILRPILPAACRFTPSCSEYAVEAIQRKGVLVGSAKAAYRILRCNPFSKGGYDPVEKDEHCDEC
ncbi:MAG: membrane protein insertion efficiency factor YidD [Planctomycetota bacterium]|nr:membrane protein insertion efficiency factor YidD [Planctomycetota bacterium]MDA1138612.1 membrane protein insertion efficiency factor YidD [Planctomycetota bacterium]